MYVKKQPFTQSTLRKHNAENRKAWVHLCGSLRNTLRSLREKTDYPDLLRIPKHHFKAQIKN